MTFDPKCWELAEHFLPDDADDGYKTELAQHIQDEIKTWIEGDTLWREDDERRKALRTLPPGRRSGP